MSYGAHEMLFEALRCMKLTLNVLKANKHLSPSLEAEAMVLNAKILEIEQDLENLP